MSTPERGDVTPLALIALEMAASVDEIERQAEQAGMPVLFDAANMRCVWTSDAAVLAQAWRDRMAEKDRRQRLEAQSRAVERELVRAERRRRKRQREGLPPVEEQMRAERGSPVAVQLLDEALAGRAPVEDPPTRQTPADALGLSKEG
jgi:hypothetical protein